MTVLVNITITLRSLIMQSGLALHNIALRTLLDASRSFLTSACSGTILSFFSQDLNLIDSELPMAVLNMSLDVFSAIGSAVVIATTSPFVIVSYPIILIFLYGVQRFYLRTSLQMRTPDLEGKVLYLSNEKSKVPLTVSSTHFLGTISGIITIRAMGSSGMILRSFSKVLHESQQFTYLLAMIQRWLMFTKNIIVAVLAIAIVTMATQLRTATKVGLADASLVFPMALGELLANLVRMYMMMKMSISAVARLKAFADDTAVDGNPDSWMVSPIWPQREPCFIDTGNDLPHISLFERGRPMHVEKADHCGAAAFGTNSLCDDLVEYRSVS
ncbi:ABC transporter type 1, transmembrane domain-containing protein [Colletotrichum cereale]|nr:ABC transporter type 1, transmembrane domain-containing protein [Colletotrichum cereale]